VLNSPTTERRRVQRGRGEAEEVFPWARLV